MKKFLLIIGGILVAAYLSIKIYREYDRTHLMSDQAVFEVYLDIDESDFDSYFRLEKGTYDPDLHDLICELPVQNTGFRPSCVYVKLGTGNTVCDQEYNPDRDTKYRGNELSGYNFRLLLVKKLNMPIALFDPHMAGAGSKIIGSQEMGISYQKGKINRIVIGDGEAYEYCNTNSR